MSRWTGLFAAAALTWPAIAAAPAVAQSNPADLAPALADAAHAGDLRAFLDLTSSGTRRALAGAEAAQARLADARRSFYAAIAERFGTGQQGQDATPAVTDGRAALSRFGEITLAGAAWTGPGRAVLQLRTTTKDPDGRTATGVFRFPAVRESGRWKLDLTGVLQSRIHANQRLASIYRQVTASVRSGTFRTRGGVDVALLRAWRGRPVRGESR